MAYYIKVLQAERIEIVDHRERLVMPLKKIQKEEKRARPERKKF